MNDLSKVSQIEELPLSLYIHFPWCIQKCPYCDFNSHEIKSGIPEASYIDALLIDLAYDLEQFSVNRPISSIFIGGGTPSLLAPDSIERLLQGIAAQTDLRDDLEITLEANPGSFESGKFSEFKATGINRLSIGIQSFTDEYLQKLGRVHSAKEAICAVEIAHQSGFENFNLDLMFGLPGSNVQSSLADMNTAIALNPRHISFYQLTLEPNTLFHKYPPKLPEIDDIFAEQKSCQSLLSQNGFNQYEISAYSKQNAQCQHNLNYWQFGDYLGIGAGAHGKITEILPHNIVRSSKFKSPQKYLDSRRKTQNLQTIAVEELPLEYLMNTLRLKDGFTLSDYFACSGLLVESLEPALSECLQQRLLMELNQRYFCTANGWNYLDEILLKFIKKAC